jgi:periplasmic divalent cation tolerance protein
MTDAPSDPAAPEAAFVYTTAPDLETARAVAGALVERRLAACVNMLPGMISVYRWNGALEEAAEVAMIVKTSAGRVAAVVAAIHELHPYEVPAAVTLPAAGGSAAYLHWIAAETGG